MQYEKTQHDIHYSFQERRAIKKMFTLLQEIDATNEKQKLEHIRWLLQQYPLIINARDDEGRTPLIVAARHESQEVVKFLIDQHATLDLQDNNGATALIVAAINGNMPSVRHLVHAGANLNKQDDKGFTALIQAAALNNIKMVRLLIASGAQIDKKTEDGCTAFMYAAGAGNKEMIRLLVAAGAKLDLQCEHGETACALATKEGHIAEYHEAVKAGQEERESYQKMQQPIREELEEYLVPVLANIAHGYLFSIIPEEEERESSQEPAELAKRMDEREQRGNRSCITQ